MYLKLKRPGSIYILRMVVMRDGRRNEDECVSLTAATIEHEPIKIIFLCGISVAFSFCLSYNYYDGPERAKSETAEVWVLANGAMGQAIIGVNGQKVHFGYKKRPYFLPEKHTFDLQTQIYISDKGSFVWGFLR